MEPEGVRPAALVVVLKPVGAGVVVRQSGRGRPVFYADVGGSDLVCGACKEALVVQDATVGPRLLAGLHLRCCCGALNALQDDPATPDVAC